MDDGFRVLIRYRQAEFIGMLGFMICCRHVIPPGFFHEEMAGEASKSDMDVFMLRFAWQNDVPCIKPARNVFPRTCPLA
jgi:hypothetical protein